MKSNRTESCKCRFVEGNLAGGRGDASCQQAGNTGEFAVYGKSSARAGHTITGLNVRDALTHGDDRSSTAVSGRLWLIETAAYRVHGGENAITPHFINDIAHKVGPGLRFLQQALA